VCALISHFGAVPELVKSLADKELIHKAKSDNTDLFRNFAASSPATIGAIPLTCDYHGAGKPHFYSYYALVCADLLYPAAIPYNEGTHLKYFTKGREVYEEYYDYMLRASAIFDPRHKPIMWDKMDTILRLQDSDRTADWWKRYWRQAWTLADCGYGN
jgi:hypothetical protein